MGLDPTTFCMASARVCSHPFAAVRSIRHVCRVFVRASERHRTRTNAQPCHSCHASLGTETLPSQTHSRGATWTL